MHRLTKERNRFIRHTTQDSTMILQLEIDCIEWALKKIEVNKIPNDRLEAVIRTMIKDLEKRKDKAMKRSDTDDYWIKTESLQWVLYVIFAVSNRNMVVV
jgi:hypothetical protein